MHDEFVQRWWWWVLECKLQGNDIKVNYKIKNDNITIIMVSEYKWYKTNINQ